MEGIYDYRLPSPALRGYVRQLQIIGCSFPAALVALPVKAYWPRAENSLAFYPKDPEKIEYGFSGLCHDKPRSTVNGQYSLVTSRHVGRDFMVFQVQFQPGALHQLTGLPIHELTNTFLDAEALFSAEIRRVNERLSYCTHYSQMIEVVEAFLLQLISRAKRKHLQLMDQVSRYLLDYPSTSLDYLANQTCLSQRQFYRQFVEREGISPKLYARIARFQKAMKLKNAQPQKDWLTIALELDYYDYQHLVRDFKEFTSLTPNAFMQQETQAPERAFGKIET